MKNNWEKSGAEYWHVQRWDLHWVAVTFHRGLSRESIVWLDIRHIANTFLSELDLPRCRPTQWSATDGIFLHFLEVK